MTEQTRPTMDISILEIFAKITAIECGPEAPVAIAAQRLNENRTLANLDGLEVCFRDLPDHVARTIASGIEDELSLLNLQRRRQEQMLRDQARLQRSAPWPRVAPARARQPYRVKEVWHDVNRPTRPYLTVVGS